MASLMPVAKQQYFDSNGVPLSGGKVYTYAAGTTTPLATYTDSSGSTPNANPVVLDSRGEASIFFTTSAYKIVLKDSAGLSIWTQDNLLPESTTSDLVTYTPAGTGAVATTVQTKLRESVSANDKGAAGTGSGDDLTAINNAITQVAPRGNVVLPSGSYLVSAAPTNPYGVQFEGNGVIVKAITGGNQQLNTYADKYKLSIGHEYLFRLYYEINAGTASLAAYVYGDSTTTDGYTSSTFYLSTLLPELFARRGIQTALTVTNRGVAGTNISNLNAVPDLLVGVGKIFFIKYGINDGSVAGDRLSTFATTLRAKLAELRANANGDISQLTIVLVGPNSTSDTPNGRDEYWYEQLRGVYEQAARDYQCFYFDTYAYLKDARWAAGLSMDNPFGDGRAIHPNSTMQAMIWGKLFDEMCGWGESVMWTRNQLRNTGSTYETPLAATLPNSYPYGVTVQRGTAANGWNTSESDTDGAVVTVRQSDGCITQSINTYSPGITRIHTRNGDPGTNAWGRWTGVHETITLANSWANQAGWASASAAIDPDGFVQCRGLITGGTSTSGTTVGTLPAGMRPANTLMFAVPAAGASGTAPGTVLLQVASSGAISIWSTFSGTYMSLSNISFKAA